MTERSKRTMVGEDDLQRLEAILYASGRPLSLTALCAHLRLGSEREVSALVRRLSELYERDGSALEARELPGGRVVLQLRAEFNPTARRFSAKPLLTSGPLRTLSFVALHQPVEQKRVAEARGGPAYRHLRALEEMGLVSRQRRGRAVIVETTQEFADSLGLSGDLSALKRQLGRVFKGLELKELEGG